MLSTYKVRYSVLRTGLVLEEAITCNGDHEARQIVWARYGESNVRILMVTRIG